MAVFSVKISPVSRNSRDDYALAVSTINCIPKYNSMSQYIRDDNFVRVSESSTLTVSDTLPLGTYLLKFDENRQQFYLKRMEDFVTHGKIYGEHNLIVERIISTFMSRENRNTGVLLSGVKGSGKTLTAKMISMELATRYQYPTIVVNQGFNTALLAAFLHTVDVPCMILFDEFDKVYSYKEDESATQSGLLDILDGVFSSRKLFILSCNNASLLNPYFFSRPGRVFYHYRYGGLNESIVEQYCDDHLLYPDWKREIMQLSVLVQDLTFDILQAVVEETNRYNESPRSFMGNMNVSYSLDGIYDVQLYNKEGRLLGSYKKRDISFGHRGWSISLPRTQENIALTKVKGAFLRDDEEDDEVYGYYTPELSDLSAVSRNGTLELSLNGGTLLAVLSRSVTHTLNYETLISMCNG